MMAPLRLAVATEEYLLLMVGSPSQRIQINNAPPILFFTAMEDWSKPDVRDSKSNIPAQHATGVRG